MFNPDKMLEIRWHGRGGQGAVTSAEILAEAAISEGKYAQAFPSFGPERRGAPVQAFNRINANKQIRIRSSVTEPDVVVVLDSGLMGVVKVASGIKPGGILIVNTSKSAQLIKNEFDLNVNIATVAANTIALEELGVPITNTTMLGAVIKATEAVRLESIFDPIRKRFGRLADKNIAALKRAFTETVIKEISVGQITK